MFSKDGTAVLEAPLTSRVPKAKGRAASGGDPSGGGLTGAGSGFGGGLGAGSRRVAGAPTLRRDLSEDFAKRSVATAFGDEPEEYVPPKRFSGLRFRLRGGVPRSTLGRVLAGAVVLGALGAFTAVLWGARTMLLHDPRLVIPSSTSIQTTGNSHLTRAQMLTIFGGDVDRNILTVPLADRREELESLPWVEHATVMRLLPNKVRVAVTERTPVAFVRQGGHIGLVDGHGVLLEMNPDVKADSHYSFPVLTGITADEPLSTRAARMKLYEKFVTELDGGGAGPGSGSAGAVSRNLSEVDLSSPEDVMALIPGGAGAAAGSILVHFGDDDFLARYQRFEKNIAEWKSSHPNLAAVDMRYEREAVLEMKPGTAAVAAAPGETVEPAVKAGKKPAVAAHHAAVAAKGKVPAKPVKAAARPAGSRPVATAPAGSRPAGGHLQTAFAVHPGGAQAASRMHATAVNPQ